MRVITVSRQYGSGGSVIAKMVADRLDWTIVDNDFVDRVAERVGLPPEEVAEPAKKPQTNGGNKPARKQGKKPRPKKG